MTQSTHSIENIASRKHSMKGTHRFSISQPSGPSITCHSFRDVSLYNKEAGRDQTKWSQMQYLKSAAHFKHSVQGKPSVVETGRRTTSSHISASWSSDVISEELTDFPTGLEVAMSQREKTGRVVRKPDFPDHLPWVTTLAPGLLKVTGSHMKETAILISFAHPIRTVPKQLWGRIALAQRPRVWAGGGITWTLLSPEITGRDGDLQFGYMASTSPFGC